MSGQHVWPGGTRRLQRFGRVGRTAHAIDRLTAVGRLRQTFDSPDGQQKLLLVSQLADAKVFQIFPSQLCHLVHSVKVLFGKSLVVAAQVEQAKPFLQCFLSNVFTLISENIFATTITKTYRLEGGQTIVDVELLDVSGERTSGIRVGDANGGEVLGIHSRDGTHVVGGIDKV